MLYCTNPLNIVDISGKLSAILTTVTATSTTHSAGYALFQASMNLFAYVNGITDEEMNDFNSWNTSH